MLAELGKTNLSELYDSIPEDCRFQEFPDLPDELEYAEVAAEMLSLADKNNPRISFIGDGLPHYRVMPVVGPVSAIRNLTTTYTPYQPELAQGTLQAHWIYQCLMSQITGFEAINSSLYERSTALYEAIATAVRIHRKGNIVLVSEGMFPSDREVVETLLPGTGIFVHWIPLDPDTGRTSLSAFKYALEEFGDHTAAIVYPHVNQLGLLENVDDLNDLAIGTRLKTIALIDPALLGKGGLKPPTEFGQNGADMIVGEAQHLAIGPNFGGPGLGLFGVRHNATDRNAIRQTPGRYVGKAHDEEGRECRVMVLSTREQHIRKDKATSNICSNQAFLASLAGASLLSRGESGLAECFSKGSAQARQAVARLTAFEGIELAWPRTPFVNEPVFRLARENAAQLIEAACKEDLHLGVDMTGRCPGVESQLLKISFFDRDLDADRLIRFFENRGYRSQHGTGPVPEIPLNAIRSHPPGLPVLEDSSIVEWYKKAGDLNVSPDDVPYPLGSCTMKYNPHINDWAAGLPGFTDLHPQAPIEDAQGSLEILYRIQEWFKEITGLAGVTTQPVAGAQGELVGIKLFQAYHASRGDRERDVILIPASAHGTNFATASMAGFHSKTVDGLKVGIQLLDAAPDGTVDFDQVDSLIEKYKDRLAGIMITNPNTSGIFENRFREISDKVHQAGGLIYMDGANMNAIAGWCDLGKMGVDAVHNNLHKTWSIPHGGGGPGDAIVAVSEKLVPFLPGVQIRLRDGVYFAEKPCQSIGSFHRHWGNFAHKVRTLTYLLRLGKEGIPRMSAVSVLAANYTFAKLRGTFPSLPAQAGNTPRMHEFILTLGEGDFAAIEEAGLPKALAIPRIGKLFLDFGYHAPTVAWPETFGLMIEPTESFSQPELDRFAEAVLAIGELIREHPRVLHNVPLFTPIGRVDEVAANRSLQLMEPIRALPELPEVRTSLDQLRSLTVAQIRDRILEQLPSAETP